MIEETTDDFFILLRPLHEDDIRNIPYWTECRSVANVDEAELKEQLDRIRKGPHVSRLKNKDAKTVRFNLGDRDKKNQQQQLKKTKQKLFPFVISPHEDRETTSDTSHVSTGDKTLDERIEVNEEDIFNLIPATYEALQIDVDNLFVSQDDEDDNYSSDSVSYISSESGEYEFQACPRTV